MQDVEYVEDSTPYIQTKIGDSVQRFYAGGKVQFAPAENAIPWVTTDIWTITQLVGNNSIEVVMDGAVPQEVNLNEAQIRVFEVPDEIRADNMGTDKIAPFHLEDDYGYADEDYFWIWAEVAEAADLFTQDNEHDVRVLNAFSNDVEYFEYNSDDEEEDEDEA